jgi:RNA polymerase sigma-70 factor (ECF subfamily)
VENREKLKEIIEGCLRNNRRSQEELFKLFYGKMLPVCLRYISDRDSAQEVLQEGFIKVFEKLEAFDYKGSFEGWIRRIIANTAIDAIRKSKKDPYRTDDDNDFKLGASDPMVEQEEIEFTDLKAEIAMEAIQQLSPAYRTVFNLYVLEDYSHKEIGELLGISEGTSKSNLAKAKMNLQKILNEKFMNIR